MQNYGILSVLNVVTEAITSIYSLFLHCKVIVYTCKLKELLIESKIKIELKNIST